MVKMSVKGPREDPATARARQQAESRAEKNRTDATQRDLGRLTEELLRTFGRRGLGTSLGGGLPGAGGGVGAAAGGGGGVAAGGGSYDPGAIFVDVDPFSEGGFSDSSFS